MWNRKKNRLADLEARNRILVQQLEDAREESASWKWAAKRHSTAPDVLEQHDAHRKALAHALRCGRERNWDQLIKEAASTYKAAEAWMQDTHRANERRRRALRACIRYRAELHGLRKLQAAAARPAPERWKAELRDARRALMLSERARASLDKQLEEVQAANESLCREAVDRAGTLAPQGVSR